MSERTLMRDALLLLHMSQVAPAAEAMRELSEKQRPFRVRVVETERLIARACLLNDVVRLSHALQAHALLAQEAALMAGPPGVPNLFSP